MALPAPAWLGTGLLDVSVAHAAPPRPVEGQIAEINIEGTRRIDDAAVLAAMSMVRGGRLTPQVIRRDLKAIYQTGFFEDVEILVEDTQAGPVVRVLLVEKPAIREVRIEGSKKVDEEDLREVISLRALGVLNEADIAASVREMRNTYLEKGFYLAEIDVDEQDAGADQVDVVFTVKENRKVMVQTVEFSGNENISDEKIKRYLQVKEAGVVPWLTSRGNFDEALLDTDRQIVTQIFLEEGYVDVRVDPPRAYLSPDKRSIFISYAIDEGEQYALGTIDVEGDFLPELGLEREAVRRLLSGAAVEDIQEEKWRAELGKRETTIGSSRGPKLVSGETYKQSVVYQVREAIERLYQDQGFAFVNVIPLTKTDPEYQTVDISFRIETGEQVRIGKINIRGNDPTHDKVVRREIRVAEGDIYRGSLIRASRMRLERLGFFEEVNISTPRGSGTNVLDMNVQVSEQPTGSFSLGAGYSNLESLVVTANVAKNNFMGLGYNMSAAVNWSRLRRQFNLSFLDPYFLDSRWLLNVNAYSVSRNFFGAAGPGQIGMGNFGSLGTGMNEYQRGGSIGVGRYLDHRDDLQLRADYTIEDVGLTNIDAYRQHMYGGELYRNGLTSTLGLTFSVDKRNNRIFPTKGYYASASTSVSGGFRLGDDSMLSLLGGDFNFVEHRVNGRLYQPLLKKNDAIVFRVNSTIGSVHSTDGRLVPFIHRFRAGGINSVRGYNWFSLGPSVRVATSEDPVRADDRMIVGGTQTWVNNFEVEAQVVRSAGISAVVFYDAGNAFGDPWGEGGLSIGGLRSAAGAGVRWRSPMGPLRFEWGFPLEPKEGERSSVFDFSIGSFF